VSVEGRTRYDDMWRGTVVDGVGVWPLIVSSSHSQLARADNICRRSVGRCTWPHVAISGCRLVRAPHAVFQRVATRAFNYWLFLRRSMLIWHDVWKTVVAVANRCAARSAARAVITPNLTASNRWFLLSDFSCFSEVNPASLLCDTGQRMSWAIDRALQPT